MNRNARVIVSLVAGAALSASLAHAQQPGRTGSGQPGRQGSQVGQGQLPPRPPVDRALDANDDHVIDADEIAAASTSILALDADGDGRLSASECLPPPPEGRGGPLVGRGPGGGMGRQGPQDQQGPQGHQSGAGPMPPAPPIFTALDSNGDQSIDGDEISAAPSTLLTLDRDGDGQLSGAECRPPRSGRQRRGASSWQ